MKSFEFYSKNYEKQDSLDLILASYLQKKKKNKKPK